MIYGSVCSGIEAASAAWEPLGWTPAFFSEVNPFCSDLLKYHYPQVTNHGDFTKLIPLYEAGEGPKLDVLVGGTPCQSFSIAGLRGGLQDARGGLALSFVRLVAAARPRWVVWENVPGSLSADGGRAFASLVGGLQELGYGVAWRVLDAQYVRVDGFSRAVPQRRRRVFLVGHSSGDVRRPAAVLFEPESVRGNRPPRRTTRQEAASRSREGAGACGSTSSPAGSEQEDLAFNFEQFSGTEGPISPTITSTEYKGKTLTYKDHDGIPEVCGTLSDGAHHGGGLNGQDAFSGRIIPVQPVPYDLLQVTHPLNAQNRAPGDPCHCLAKDNASSAAIVTQDPWRVRRLTPLECERLMGFVDGWTDIPRKNKRPVDGHRYKALGNSIAVNCMRWLGERMQLVEDTLTRMEQS